MCLMCSSCSYSPAVSIPCLPRPHPRAASTNPAGSRLCADGMGTFCRDFDPSVVPKGCTQGQRADPGEGIFKNCYWFSSFPSIFFGGLSALPGRSSTVLHAWLSLNKEPFYDPARIFHCSPNSITPFPQCLALPSQPGGSCSSPALCTGMSCKASPVLCSKNFHSLPEFSFQVFLSKLSSLEDNKTSCCRSL